jgi:hypothetical protein
MLLDNFIASTTETLAPTRDQRTLFCGGHGGPPANANYFSLQRARLALLTFLGNMNTGARKWG